MDKSKKYYKIIYLVLAFVFIYNSFGYLFVYFPASSIIKYVVSDSIKKNKISKENLIVLTFDINDFKQQKYDFKWVKPGKEFLYGGKMYDVKNKIIKDHKILYSCFYDHAESILEKIFADYLNNTKKDFTQNITGSIFLFGLFYEEIKTNHSQFCNDDISNIQIRKIENGLSDFFSDIPTPPPRLIS